MLDWIENYRERRRSIVMQPPHSNMIQDRQSFDDAVEALIVRKIRYFVEQAHLKNLQITPEEGSIRHVLGEDKLKDPHDPDRARLRGTFDFYKGGYDTMFEPENRCDALDLRDKRRVLLFRILTALSMGAVVLFTYWVGDYFGIPLPLRAIPIASM